MHLFLTKGTGKFTGYSRSAFPYILAAKEDQNIFSDECTPKKFQLMDPDHLTSSEIDSLYNHWAGRQRKGLQPFIILNASPQHAAFVKKSEKVKGKREIPYVEVSEDEDSEKDDSDGLGEQENETSAMEGELREAEEAKKHLKKSKKAKGRERLARKNEILEAEEGKKKSKTAKGKEKMVEEEEEEMEVEDGGEEVEDDETYGGRYRSGVKRGPPVGKAKSHVTFEEGTSSGIAGPSSIHIPKEASKTKIKKSSKEGKVAAEIRIGAMNTRNASKKSDSEKRKLEEEQSAGGSRKRSKIDVGNSGKEGKPANEKPERVSMRMESSKGD